MGKTSLSTKNLGILKSVFGVSMVFISSMGIGLYVLHQRHEKTLDKLEKDTAIACLDFAAKHYEDVIRRRDKVTADKITGTGQPTTMMPCYEKFLEFQRTLDNFGKYEPTEEEWNELEEELLLQQKEHDELLQRLGEQQARVEAGLDRLKLKLLAKKAAELADKDFCYENEAIDVDPEEFQNCQFKVHINEL